MLIHVGQSLIIGKLFLLSLVSGKLGISLTISFQSQDVQVWKINSLILPIVQ